MLLLGWICSFFCLLESILAAVNEMVVEELGGVEVMMVSDLGFFEELKKKKMEIAMEL